MISHMKTITSSAMSCSKQISLLFLPLLLCVSLSHAGVLKNPDFESGDLSGWDIREQSLSIGVTTNTTWNRNYAARISGTHSGSGWVTNTISQTIPIIPGDAIQALGFVHWKTFETTSGSAQGYLEARLDGPDGMEGYQVWTEPHDGWVFFDFGERATGVANGGFETGTIMPWEGAEHADDLDILLSRDIKRSGDYALRMKGSWDGGWSFNQVLQVFPLTAGDVIRARAWVKAETFAMGAGGDFAVAGIKLELEDTPHQWEAVVTPAEEGDEWVELNFFAPITQTDYYVFRCMVAGDSGSSTVEADIYFDDVQVHIHHGELLNAGFETGDTEYWSVATDEGTVEVTGTVADEGNYSLRILGDWAGSSSDRAVQKVYLEEGDQVTVNGRIRIDTLHTTGEWLISGIQLGMEEGPNQFEDVFQYHSAPSGWQDLSIVQTVPETGVYEVRCIVMGGTDGNSQANVYFDDMQLLINGSPGGEPHEVTLSINYIGTAGGGANEVDIYFDTALIDGSSANPDRMDDIHEVLIDKSSSIAAVGGSIPAVKYPSLFAYGYPGGDTNVINYPAHVEVGVASWRFRHMTNDVTLDVVNTIEMYGLGGAGPGYIEFDQYRYVGRRWGTHRGEPLDILTDAPYWTLGERDGTSDGFGDGPFDEVHTFVVGQDDLSNFPRRMVTDYHHYGAQWPRILHIEFEENLGQYDRDYDKFFVLSTVTTNGPDSGQKAARIKLFVEDPGNTNLNHESFELHMGWATEEESYGMVDYPNVTYQGHNEVFLRKGYLYGLVDREGWYSQPVARGSATIEPIKLYTRKNGKWTYLPYEEYLYAWPNAGSGIRSVFDEDHDDRLPGPISYHVGFKIGHQYGTNEFGEAQFPNVIEIRGNGYFRMTDYDGVMGGSLRPIAADIFGLYQYREDSPIMPEAYVSLASRTTPTNELSDSFMRIYLPVQSKTNEWFTGVVKVDAHFSPDQVADEGVYLDMQTDIFANRPLVLAEHGPLNLFAQVNMYWRGSKKVNQDFEGHDHDTIIVKKANGEWVTHNTVNPPTNIYPRTLATLESGDVVYIMQQDRGPLSYGFDTEAPYRRVSHFEFAILDDGGRNLSLDVFEQNTISEINDNIVIACAVNEDLEMGEHVQSLIRYRSFYAPGVIMAQPNTPDGGDGWGDNTYTIEFYATDGEDKPLRANIYYGNGKDDDWTLINEGETLLVPQGSHKISYDWDVSDVPPGAYYIKAGVERVEGGKKGFAVSRSRLQVGPTYGFPNMGASEVTIVTNEYGYLGENMSFETGHFGGWAHGGDDLDIYVTDERAYHGNYSARMHGDWSGWSWNAIAQEITPVVPGETLLVEGRIYIGNLVKGGADWLRCGIKLENSEDSTDQAGAEIDASVATGTWVRVEFERTTPLEGTDRLLLWVAGHDCPAADVYFDDIRIMSTNAGTVVTNEIRRGYWEGDIPVDVTGYDVLSFHVAMEEGGDELMVWVADNDGVTNALAVTDYVSPLVDAAQRVMIPWADFDFGSIDLSQVKVIGFTAPEGLEPEVTGMRAGPNPISASVEFIAPPMTNPLRGDLPHYNPWEDVIQRITLVNQSGADLNNVTIQLVQEYGETTWWWDNSPHVDPMWSERSHKGDRLNGNFERIWKQVTIPSDGSIVLTNVYKMPEGRFIDNSEFAIPAKEDWFAGRNYDGLAQVRLVVRTDDGDNVYDNDQIASYSMDDDYDLDNDGLPDWWEILYSGSPIGMNPDDDLDGDGYTNLEEFLAGSDPLDPNSYPGHIDAYILRLAYSNGVDHFPRAMAEQPHYTGVASAWMIARYLHGPTFDKTQDEIYAANVSNPDHNNEITPQSCADWMYYNAPWGYYFSARFRYTLEEALRETVYWMDFTPPGGLKSPVYILCGTNWSYKVVRGFHTDKAPYDGDIYVRPDNVFEIYGLWLNDPAQGGIGYNMYATASELESIYRPSLDDGRRWLVAEPPKEAEEYEKALQEMEMMKIRLAEPEPNSELSARLKSTVSDPTRITRKSGDGSIQFGAIETKESIDHYDALPPVLRTDPGFMGVFNRANESHYYHVNSHLAEEDQYMLAAGSEAGPGSTLYVLKLGMDGAFQQATWEENSEVYLPLFQKAAEWLMFQKYELGTPPPDQNLLSNPSFEEGTGQDGWWGDASVSHWNKIGDGTGWWAGSGGGDPETQDGSDWLIKFWSSGQGVYQDVGVTGGTAYDFSVWAFNNGNEAMSAESYLQLKVEWFDGVSGIGSGSIDTLFGDTAVDTWTQLSGTVTAPANADRGRFVVVTENIGEWGGAVYFDNAQMAESGDWATVEEARLVYDPDIDGSAFHPRWKITVRTAGDDEITDTFAQSQYRDLLAQDSDGNGVSDWHELYAGTDPLDAGSVLLGTGAPVSDVPGQVRIIWESAPGRTYSIWRSTNTLNRKDFERISSGIPAVHPVNEYLDVPPSGRAYYRIEVE